MLGLDPVLMGAEPRIGRQSCCRRTAGPWESRQYASAPSVPGGAVRARGPRRFRRV